MTAGMSATAAFYPLELLKTRMQVISKSHAAYRNALSSLQSVVRLEGVLGLYKGLAPGLLASGGSWGGYFFLYENSKSRKLSQSGDRALGAADHVSPRILSLVSTLYHLKVISRYRSGSGDGLRL
jgi:hypothetical protein